MMLAVLARTGHRELATLSPAAARADIRQAAALLGPLAEPVAAVEDLTVDGAAGSLPARLYRPAHDRRARPLVVYYHGGGWVVGDLDTHDGACRFLARTADVGVLSVDYRLAPEHRFPAAVDDAVAAFRWAVGAAARLGFDADRLAVAGDSAGGNLAAVVSWVTTRNGGPAPAGQLLIYPVTDLSTKHPSYALFSTGFFLTAAEMDWYRGHYLPSEDAARDPRASPLLAPDLTRLPPAIVLTAGFDVLRDEGEAYAERLRAAGVPVDVRRLPGLIHGFCNTTPTSRGAHEAMTDASRRLATLLAAPRAPRFHHPA
jgi:acetyl esterase